MSIVPFYAAAWVRYFGSLGIHIVGNRPTFRWDINGTDVHACLHTRASTSYRERERELGEGAGGERDISTLPVNSVTEGGFWTLAKRSAEAYWHYYFQLASWYSDT